MYIAMKKYLINFLRVFFKYVPWPIFLSFVSAFIAWFIAKIAGAISPINYGLGTLFIIWVGLVLFVALRQLWWLITKKGWWGDKK